MHSTHACLTHDFITPPHTLPCTSPYTPPPPPPSLPTAQQTLRYGQPVHLDGPGLTAVAYPAGSGLGHAVWVIQDGERR